MTTKEADAVIAALAKGQSRVASREQLLRAGLSAKMIEGRASQGQLIRLYRGVYQVGAGQLDARGELAAALIRGGSGSWVAGLTAAGVRDIGKLDLDAIELGCPHRLREPSLTVRRARTLPTPGLEVDLVRGLRVSTVPYLLLEAAPRSTDRELEELITLAVRTKQFDLPAIEAVLAAHPHTTGIRNLRRALRYYRSYANSKSRLERAFDRWIAKFPDIPNPEGNGYIDGWEIDRQWPQWRLCVEIDGRPWHEAIRDRGKDNVKDAALQLLGWHLIRIDEHAWDTRRNTILETIRGFRDLALRAA